jgi:hypothetical protein
MILIPKKEITTTMAELNRLWNKVLAQSNAELAIEGPATLRNDLKTWVDELATDVKATTKKAGSAVDFPWIVRSGCRFHP